VISPTQSPVPDDTQHSRQTHIRSPRGIRTCNPSKRVAADPRLRPRGHWHRQILHIYPTQIYEAQNNNTLFIARQCYYHKATEAPDRPMALDSRRTFGRSDRENTSQFLHLKVVTCWSLQIRGCSFFNAGSYLTTRPNAEGEAPASNNKFILDTVFFQTWKMSSEHPVQVAVANNTDDWNKTGE
jgi:hypothetical protein